MPSLTSNLEKPGCTAVGEVLHRSLSGLGLFKRARKYEVFSLWAQIVGDLNKYATPRRFQGDVLHVATASSVWSAELSFMQSDLLAKANDALGGRYIKEMRFSEHLWETAQLTKCAQPARFDHTLAPSPATDEIASQLTDGRFGQEISDKRLFKAFTATARTMKLRREYLLAHNFLLCESCGDIYPRELKECPACRLRRESSGYNAVMAALDKEPHRRDEEILRECGISHLYIVERARRDLLSKTRSMIGYRLGILYAREQRVGQVWDSDGEKRRKKQARAEIPALGRKLVSLTTKTPYEGLTEEEIQKVVSKRLWTILRKG